jgi:hypothetical protein
LVLGGGQDGGVYYHHNDAGGLGHLGYLILRLGFYFAAVLGQPGCVYEVEVLAAPANGAGVGVAGGASTVVGDGLACAHEPVKQARFANVGAANDGDYGS